MIPLSNAAGWLKKPADVTPLYHIPNDILSAVTLGSYTRDSRGGNTGNNFWDDGDGRPTSMNALGLPNPGYANAAFLDTLIPAIKKSGKKARVSIAGFSTEDYRQLAINASHLGADEIEINLGCPNVRSSGAQKPIFAFDPQAVHDIINAIYNADVMTIDGPTWAVKLSPYSDPHLLAKIAVTLGLFKSVLRAVVVSNTFPNALGFDARGKTVIDANGGQAGLAGHAMKHIALGQVRQFRERLPEEMTIIGVGGISCGADVRDMELAGAHEVQVGTAFFTQGPRIFPRIAQEYVEQFEPT